jgi:hypothetical protein
VICSAIYRHPFSAFHNRLNPTFSDSDRPLRGGDRDDSAVEASKSFPQQNCVRWGWAVSMASVKRLMMTAEAALPQKRRVIGSVDH